MSKALPSLSLGLGAELENLLLAHHVAQRLTGPDDVAVDLARARVGGIGGVREVEGERLLARPVHGVQPGVDHQPHRPQRLPGSMP